MAEKTKRKYERGTEHSVGLLDPNISVLLSALKDLQSSAKRPPALLTIPDAAKYLGGVKTDFVRELVTASEIKVIQRVERGKILIPVAELDKWIQRQASYVGAPRLSRHDGSS